MKSFFTTKNVVLTVIIVPFLFWWLGERFGVFEKLAPSSSIHQETEKKAGDKRAGEAKQFSLVPVAEGLEVPWGAVFTSSERLLVTERPGRVRVVESGRLQPNPIHTFENVAAGSEEGLMGIAVDPHYSENKYLYFAHAYRESGKEFVKVVRVTDEGSALANEYTVIDSIPAAKYHAGTRIAFGPDQKLYITTGDATDKSTPQNLESLGGKILRLNPDGSIPEDNPFEGKATFSYGHRNSQGLAWDTRNNELYATEHGPSVFDGPAGGDEVNHIMPGNNYGWPLVSHLKKLDDTEEPLVVFTPAVAPAGLLFYTGSTLPQFTNTFLFAALKGEGLYQIILDEDDPDEVEGSEKVEGIEVGRIRDVFQDPQGQLYIMTSNRDGRGKPSDNDDTIYRLVPQE